MAETQNAGWDAYHTRDPESWGRSIAGEGRGVLWLSGVSKGLRGYWVGGAGSVAIERCLVTQRKQGCGTVTHMPHRTRADVR